MSKPFSAFSKIAIHADYSMNDWLCDITLIISYMNYIVSKTKSMSTNDTCTMFPYSTYTCRVYTVCSGIAMSAKLML